jgi:hypothetical protein
MSSVPNVGRQSDTLLNDREGSPWRYVCPECGSSAIRTRFKTERDGRSGRTSGGLYYCEGHSGAISTVYDKRQGIEVRP